MTPTTNTQHVDFLPNLCTVQAVFHLVLVGELLAFALTITRTGVLAFDWFQLGVLSILVQWVVLSSAACLCPLRPWLNRQHPIIAGASSYTLVLFIAVAFSIGGTMISGEELTPDWNTILTNFVLAALFAGIVLRYFYLQQQLRNQQQAELTARIQALQSRIRPHFLFNSMNSIASLIDIDPEAAEHMVVDLSDLFRASLSEPGLIPMDRELELCKRFASIEQTRIGERLRLEWELNYPKNLEVPSLLIQPIVENAIYHGIQPLTEGGTVRVEVSRSNTECTVTVSNPIGDKSQSNHEGNGMALANIRHRLEAYYQNKGRLNVETNETTYNVTVHIPHNSEHG